MRTPAFRAFARTIALARRSPSEARAFDASRRDFLKSVGAAGAVWSLARPDSLFAQTSASVAIVGAGLAGLSCADRLAARGIAATLYDAAEHVGGRCSSLDGTFPGQVVQRGGELIDNLHKTMLGYVKRYRLTLEDYEKQPGEVFYHFDGQHSPESAVVHEYRALVAAMRDDLRTLSGEPTADSHTPADIALDQLSIADYLATRGAGLVVTQAIEAAYLAEYGLEIDQRSALNLLLFIHADKRSRFMPFGVFSDERYHVVEGNDRIASGLAADLPQPIRQAHLLRRVARRSDGRIELTFDTGGAAASAAFDHVVLTLPFTALREVDLDPSLALPPWKLDAINSLGYGTNAKMMVGFDGPYWREQGSSGASYSDLPHHQTTWETNPTGADNDHAVLTDYSSGRRGALMNPAAVGVEADLFLGDLEQVFPGAVTRATRSGGAPLAHLAHWPSNPLTKGSYTCYKPGQFARGQPVFRRGAHGLVLRVAGIHGGSLQLRHQYREPYPEASEKGLRGDAIEAATPLRDNRPAGAGPGHNGGHMNRRHAGLCLVLAALAAPTFAGAHHSTAMFDRDARITLTGVVKEFQWTNPHSWIQVVAPGPDGKPAEWSVECGSPNTLSRQGWKPSTFKAGDKVVIVVNPMKDGTHAGLFITATLADGRVLGAGAEQPVAR